MDILVKNMVTSTTNTVLNYGSLETNIYTIGGQVTCDVPFTLKIMSDNNIVPYNYTIVESIPYTIYFSAMDGNQTVSTIDACASFTLQFDTSEQKDINLKLWKPYPISPFT
jgi:hypothetical protein